MMDHPGQGNRAQLSVWLCRAPLLAAAVFIILISGFNLTRLIYAPAPRNPWEALQIVEGWRSVQRMPVYDLSPAGHATHMYGALAPWVQGELFRWVGPNNISGRVLSLCSSLLLVIVLVVGLVGARPAWYLPVACAAMIGVSHRCGHYFAENRPDMTALLFATIGIYFLAAGNERRRPAYFILGSACLVVGFFFKQTATPFSIVPLVALCLRGRWPTRWEISLALVPVTIVCGVILGLKYLSPAVHHYMIEVPGAYSINWPRFVKFLADPLLDSPLFVVLLAECVFFDERSFREDPRLLWLMAVLAVTIPLSALARAKAGGAANSLLPMLLPMMAFCAFRLPRLLERLEHRRAPLVPRFLAGSFLAILLFCTIFPHLTVANAIIPPKSRWDPGYWQAVALARELPGKVVSPEDPTIALHAKRYAGHNLTAEKDAQPLNGNWTEAIPDRVVEEIRRADYVFDLTDYWGANIDEALLSDLGFEPATPANLDSGCYKLWRRAPTKRAREAQSAAVDGSNGNEAS
jgi:hypothetical protein